MAESLSRSTSLLLDKMGQGDVAAREKFLERIYGELRALAASQMRDERPGHTLQPTALVHEAYVRLADLNRMEWRGKAHFFAVTAEIIRRILVDHARSRRTAKRGGGAQRVAMEGVDGVGPAAGIDVVELDEALRRLALLNERQSRVVELKFFAGLEVKDIAEVLGVSEKTVKNDWRFARAWLQEELGGGTDAPGGAGDDGVE